MHFHCTVIAGVLVLNKKKRTLIFVQYIVEIVILIKIYVYRCKKHITLCSSSLTVLYLFRLGKAAGGQSGASNGGGPAHRKVSGSVC